MVENDIAARRLEAQMSYEYAKKLDKIIEALKATGSKYNIYSWTKAITGRTRDWMQRRTRLYRYFDEYVAERREMGECDHSGIGFALTLIGRKQFAPTTERRPSPFRSVVETIATPIPATKRQAAASAGKPRVECLFLKGDALTALRKLPDNTVDVGVTSPPYWGGQKDYDGDRGLGYEKTVEEYIANLVTIFDETKRVLKPEAILWIVVGDAYLNGSLQFIPARLALALMKARWIARKKPIWVKEHWKPESMRNRPTSRYEEILMVTQSKKDYFWHGDSIRTPPKDRSIKNRARFYDQHDRKGRVISDGLGANAGDVWFFATHNEPGGKATMPLDLAKQCIRTSVDDHSKAVVIDMFAGTGTTALAAAKLGHSSIYIDINPSYAKRARERIDREL